MTRRPMGAIFRWKQWGEDYKREVYGEQERELIYMGVCGIAVRGKIPPSPLQIAPCVGLLLLMDWKLIDGPRLYLIVFSGNRLGYVFSLTKLTLNRQFLLLAKLKSYFIIVGNCCQIGMSAWVRTSGLLHPWVCRFYLTWKPRGALRIARSIG
jgi:hypothetical protein